MKKISFILPVFNTEPWISECLNSIYSQHIPNADFEVICVDDCTPDNSVDVILSYQKKHDNLILLRHAENKKAGGARNTGLDKARGEYVWFVDPDDMLAPLAFKKVLEYCFSNQLDALCFNKQLKQDDQLKVDEVFVKQTEILPGCQFLNEVFGQQIIFNLGYPVRCIYKRSILIDNNIRFLEGVSYGEETTFMAEAIICSNRVMSITNALYIYRQHEQAVTSKLEKRGNGMLIYQSIIVAGNLVIQLADKADSYSSELAENIRIGIPWFVNRLLMRLVRTAKEERTVFYKALKSNPSVVKPLRPYVNFINRMALVQPYVGPIYVECCALYYSLKHKG